MNNFQRFCVCIYYVSYGLAVLGNPLCLARFEHDKQFDGYVHKDPNFIINDTKATSVPQCALKCHEYNSCAAFCYTSGTQDCQIQNTRMDKSNVDLKRLHGTQYFYKNTGGPVQIEDDQSLLLSPTTVPLHENTDTAKTVPHFTCPVNDGAWVDAYYPDGSFYQYKVFTDTNRTQAQAVMKCKDFGAFLPMFTTKSKQEAFIQKILTTCTDIDGNDFWADGDNRMDGTYKTRNNLRIPQNSELWAPGKPNNPSLENCIQMTKRHHYLFDDSTCDHKGVKTVCEKS